MPSPRSVRAGLGLSAWMLVLASLAGDFSTADADVFVWQGAGTAGNTATDPADPTTLWNQPENWDQGRLPSTWDIAYLTFTNSGYVHARNATPSSSSLYYLFIDGPTPAAGLTIDSGDYFRPRYGYIGYSAFGSVLQKAGRSSINHLNLGYNAGSYGTYDFLAGSLTTIVLSVGTRGTGIFTHAAGTHDVLNYIYYREQYSFYTLGRRNSGRSPRFCCDKCQKHSAPISI